MGFLSIDPGTTIIQLINFLIFYMALRQLFFLPVGRALAERRAHIDGLYGDIDQYTKAKTGLEAQANQIRADARRQAATEYAEARARAQAEADKIVEEYSGRAATIAEKAREKVAGEIVQARAKEDRLARELADVLISHALQEAR